MFEYRLVVLRLRISSFDEFLQLSSEFLLAFQLGSPRALDELARDRHLSGDIVPAISPGRHLLRRSTRAISDLLPFTVARTLDRVCVSEVEV